MKKTDIERIIKQGSTRQKIKLYFTDVAYFNTMGQYTANIAGGDLITKEEILTDKERHLIFSSIKEAKDWKYYTELRNNNKAFLMFKPSVSTYSQYFDYLTAKISEYAKVNLLHKIYEDAINDILEVVEDKKLREKLVETALNSLNSLNMFDAIRYQEEGFLPFIEIQEANINGNVWLLIEVLNKKIKEAKEYIEGIRTFLNKFLPLQPYKQFLKENEDKIQANIQKCRELVEDFILGKTIETPLDKAIEVTPGSELPDERFYILRWEDVEVEVTDEDIEDIKRAGL